MPSGGEAALLEARETREALWPPWPPWRAPTADVIWLTANKVGRLMSLPGAAVARGGPRWVAARPMPVPRRRG